MKTVAKSGLFGLKTRDRDRDGVFPNELFLKEASKAAVGVETGAENKSKADFGSLAAVWNR